MNPVVSVIVPVYNISKYINACVSSILQQEYINIEAILVDDGSTDKSGYICNQWIEKDSRVRVIHKSNGGLSDARNAGLEIAQGKYICFVDGDDTIEPNLLSKVVPLMEQGYDWVSYRYQYVGTEKKTDFEPLPNEIKLDSQTTVGQFITKNLMSYQVNWEAWSKIYRADIIQQHHLRFVDNKTIFAEDICFCLYYLPHCRSLRFLNTPLYNYSLREDSIMGTDKAKINTGRISLLAEEVYKYYQSIGAHELVSTFPCIYFMLLDGQIHQYLRCFPDKSIIDIRKQVTESISNKRFFRVQTARIAFLHRYTDCVISDPIIRAEKRSSMFFLLHGNPIAYRFINKLIYFRHRS